MKKFLFIMLFTLIFSILFAQIEIVLWHSYRGGEKAALKKVVKNFNESQQEIKLKALMTPFDAFRIKLQQRFR